MTPIRALEEAMKIATRETIAFITERFPSSAARSDLHVASIAVSHVTQVVDGTKASTA